MSLVTLFGTSENPRCVDEWIMMIVIMTRSEIFKDVNQVVAVVA